MKKEKENETMEKAPVSLPKLGFPIV